MQKVILTEDLYEGGQSMGVIDEIRDKCELVEIVPSRWMREYLKDKKEFSDWEKATLIWNAPNVTWKSRMASLLVLANRIKADVLLSKQIRERIHYEEKAYSLFLAGSKEYVYVVIDEDNDICGFFGDAQIAKYYGIKDSAEWHIKYFKIEKHLIISKNNLNKAPKVWHSNKELLKTADAIEDEYTGVYASCVSYDSAGNILRIDSNEMSDMENEKVDKLNRDRFEFQFFQIPFGMEVGTVVKILSEFHYGEYAVLGSGEEEWNQYMKSAIKDSQGYDFSDIQTVVYLLNNDGTWIHEHVNPLFLEAEMPEVEEGYINSEAYKEAICALGEYLKNPNEENNHKALMASRNYAKAWGDESETWGVYNIEDLMR